MLVLSRKVGERIHIGNDVFVEVRRVAGNRVTLAVNAPRSVRILRGELVEAAREFDVLEDAPVSEATKDTVIMKQNEPAANAPEPASQPQQAPTPAKS
ncbi:MAG: carbon storage regulator [Pirellulales bacterium]|nr:carbon storage regulator [Pirellulales bacterium]